MIARAGKLPATTFELSFTDKQMISPCANPSVSAAVNSKYLSGYPDNSFRPQGPLTRAEAATFIGKLL